MGNSSSVYAAVKPLEGSVDDFTNAQKASDMKYREMGIERENKLEQQKKYNKALTDKNNDDVDRRYGTAIKSEGAFTTNVQELNMNTISTLSKRLQEVTDKIKDPSLSEEERNKYRVEADAIHNSPSSIKTAGENLSTAYASHLKDVEDGNAYLNTKLRDAATLGYGATAIWDSEKNQVVYAVKQKGEDGAMVDQDTNEDGKIDSLDYVTIGDLIADTGKFKTEERYKPENVFKTLKSSVSTKQITRNDGTIETVNITPSKDQALGIVNHYFTASDGSLTPMGKSMLIEANVDFKDPIKVTAFMNQYANDLVGTKNTKSTSKQVTSDATIANQNKESVREGYTQVVYDGELQYNPDGTPMMKKTVSTTKKVAPQSSGNSNTKTTNSGGKVR